MALTRWTFVGQVMSLLFNTLSRFATAFRQEQVPFNFMAAFTVHSDFGAQKIKSVTVFRWALGRAAHRKSTAIFSTAGLLPASQAEEALGASPEAPSHFVIYFTLFPSECGLQRLPLQFSVRSPDLKIGVLPWSLSGVLILGI